MKVFGRILIPFLILMFASCSTKSMLRIAGYDWDEVQGWRKTPEEGVLLDPVAAVIIREAAKKADEMSWEEALNQVGSRPVSVKSTQDFTVRNTTDGVDVPVRLYKPHRSPYPSGEKPLILFIHGGGFLAGSIDSHDNVARRLCRETGGIVLSVGYRLAPEYPYPAAVNDSWAALLWLSEHGAEYNGDPERLVVSGDSAGGNLAAVMTLKSRDEGGPHIAAQLLYYPGMSMQMIETPSRLYYGGDKGYYLVTLDLFLEAREGYLAGGISDGDPYVSPLNAELTDNLPPALIVTAQCDPLRDEGAAYAEKLSAAGVPVEYINEKGMIHGFLNLDKYLVQSRTVTEKTGEYLKGIFR